MKLIIDEVVRKSLVDHVIDHYSKKRETFCILGGDKIDSEFIVDCFKPFDENSSEDNVIIRTKLINSFIKELKRKGKSLFGYSHSHVRPLGLEVKLIQENDLLAHRYLLPVFDKEVSFFRKQYYQAVKSGDQTLKDEALRGLFLIPSDRDFYFLKTFNTQSVFSLIIKGLFSLISNSNFDCFNFDFLLMVSHYGELKAYDRACSVIP